MAITITVNCHRGNTVNFERTEKHNDQACDAVLKSWGVQIGPNKKACPLCGQGVRVMVKTFGTRIELIHG